MANCTRLGRATASGGRRGTRDDAGVEVTIAAQVVAPRGNHPATLSFFLHPSPWAAAPSTPAGQPGKRRTPHTIAEPLPLAAKPPQHHTLALVICLSEVGRVIGSA